MNYAQERQYLKEAKEIELLINQRKKRLEDCTLEELNEYLEQENMIRQANAIINRHKMKVVK